MKSALLLGLKTADNLQQAIPSLRTSLYTYEYISLAKSTLLHNSKA